MQMEVLEIVQILGLGILGFLVKRLISGNDLSFKKVEDKLDEQGVKINEINLDVQLVKQKQEEQQKKIDKLENMNEAG